MNVGPIDADTTEKVETPPHKTRNEEYK